MVEHILGTFIVVTLAFTGDSNSSYVILEWCT